MVYRTCLPQGEKHSKQHLPHIPTARPRRQPNSLKHLLWRPVSCAMMREQAAMLSGQPKQRPTPICPFPIFKGLHAFNRHMHCQTLHSQRLYEKCNAWLSARASVHRPWNAAGELEAKRTCCAVCPALLSKQPHSPLQSSLTHLVNFQVAHATVEDTSSSHLPQLTHQQRQHVFASGRLCSTTKTDACAFQ